MTTGWDPPGWYPPRRSASPTNQNLRASDAERNEVAQKLSEHFSEGRLDQNEFNERMEQAMSAKTRGDLRGLFDDLPSLQPDPPPAPLRRHRVSRVFWLVCIIVLFSSVPWWFAWHVPWLLVGVAFFFLYEGGWGHRPFHHHRAGIEDGS